jgi:hypothetical protein
MTGIAATSGPADGPPVSRTRAVVVGIVQLLLALPLAVTAFGFLFVGMGLGPGDTVSVADVVVLGLYLVLGVSVLALLAGGVTLLVAGGLGRHESRTVRRVVSVPLWLAGASVAILAVLWLLATVFERTAGP